MNEAVADTNVIPIAPPPADPRRLPKLYAALAKAQLTIENAGMNAENPGFKRGLVAAKYADLAAVMNAIRKPLADNGLAILHTFDVARDFKSVSVTASLVHESGEHLDTTVLLPVLQATPQGVGSAVSYGRRYSACALTGLAQEDDDGMGGPMGAPPKTPPATKGQKPKPVEKAASEIPAEWKEPLDQMVARINECQTRDDVDTLMLKSQDFAKDCTAARDVARKAFQTKRESFAEKKG